MHRGYIKIWRKTKDSGLFQLPNALTLFVYMLTEAAYKPTRFGTVDIDRGQLCTGRHKLASELGISEQAIRTALEHLHGLDMITSKATNKYTVYTIVNYNNYQDQQPSNNQQDNQPTTNQQPTNNQPTTTNKEGKKERKKEDKDIDGKAADCPYSEIVNLYHEHLPMLPSVKILTDARKRQMKARWFESEKRQNLDWWGRYFKFVATVPFLIGENDRGWSADIDFIFNLKNFVKIIEGGYERRQND